MTPTPPAAGQTHRLPYLAWHEDADRRHAEGQCQTHCSACERWKWLDERCELFAATEPLPMEPNE